MQEVAFVDDQFSTELAPLAIEGGLAVNETVGAAGGVTLGATVIVTEFVAEPPFPLQTNV